MSTIRNVETEYLLDELKRIDQAIDIYEKIYKKNSVKCLTIKKLLTIKYDEKKIITDILTIRKNEKNK